MQKTLALLAVILMPTTIWAADDVTERGLPIDPRLQRSLPGVQVQSPEQQIAVLQQQVQSLQAQVAALQSALRIAPNGAVTLLSPTTVTVEAGANIYIRAGQSVSVQGGSAALVESHGMLDLKGAAIKLNGGTNLGN